MFALANKGIYSFSNFYGQKTRSKHPTSFNSSSQGGSSGFFLIENFGSETPSFYDGFTVKY
jgi:hypothetical protein